MQGSARKDVVFGAARVYTATVPGPKWKSWLEISAVTSQAGNYVILHLAPGTYTVTVEASGFRRLIHENIVVNVDTYTRLDVQLEVGEVVEEITVTGAAAPLLQTSKAEVSTVLGADRVSELPTIGRNMSRLVATVPGASPFWFQLQNHPENMVEDFRVNVNGQYWANNNRQIDGVDSNETIQGSAVVVPTIESIAEMKITTNNYDAEFGQVAGAVIETVTKGGTNDFHGSAFNYNRNSATFARNSFTEPNEPSKHNWNQFGAAAGGRVVRDKLFFFGNYQGTRQRLGGTGRGTVPVESFKRGDFSSVPGNPIFDPFTGSADGSGRTQFLNNTIPTGRIDPAAANLMALFPAPNLSGFDQNFTNSGSPAIDTDQYSVRMDYNHSDNTRVFGRYTIFESLLDVPALFGDRLGGPAIGGFSPLTGTTRSQNVSFNYQRTLTPTLFTEARVGLSRFRATTLPRDGDLRTSDEVGIPGINKGDEQTNGLSRFTVAGPVGNFTFGGRVPFLEREQVLQFANNWTNISGSHTFKFGTDIRRGILKRSDSSNNGKGDFAFNQNASGSLDVGASGLGTASFLLGTPQTYARGVVASRANEQQTRMGFYASDQWRATRNLTLSFGVRWEYYAPISADMPGGITNLNLSTGEVEFNDVGSVNKYAGLEPTYTNFGPRFGIAYQLGAKTVIRTGYGRSYAIDMFGSNFGGLSQRWPATIRQDLIADNLYQWPFILSDGPDPVPPGILPESGRIRLPDAIFYITSGDTKQTYVESWNFTVQRQLAPSASLEVSYVGNLGRNLYWGNYPNQAIPGPGDANPRKQYFARYGWTQTILNRTHDSVSNYNALQMKLDKRFSNGYSLLWSFTWEKAMDRGQLGPQNRFDYRSSRGAFNSTRRAYTAISHVWALPFRPQGGIRHLVEGWSFTGITLLASGRPFTPLLGNRASYNSPGSQLRPDRIGSGEISNPTRNGWFDETAFAVPPPFTFGNSGRGILPGPGLVSVDLALGKEFAITENVDLKFRWEVFNALNRTNLTNPVSNVDSSVAGQIFSTTFGFDMRRMQLGAHLSW